MAKESIQFEEAMKELEEVVNKLETGDVPLEEAITLYQKGMELSGICQGKLKHAEKQLISIIDEEGQVTEFEPGEGDQENEQ